jgi:hypothetical protein
MIARSAGQGKRLGAALVPSAASIEPSALQVSGQQPANRTRPSSHMRLTSESGQVLPIEACPLWVRSMALQRSKHDRTSNLIRILVVPKQGSKRSAHGLPIRLDLAQSRHFNIDSPHH